MDLRPACCLVCGVFNLSFPGPASACGGRATHVDAAASEAAKPPRRRGADRRPRQRMSRRGVRPSSSVGLANGASSTPTTCASPAFLTHTGLGGSGRNSPQHKVNGGSVHQLTRPRLQLWPLPARSR